LIFETAQDAEQAFYRAFATADFGLLKSVWASRDIACVHPGGAMILDTRAVLESWNGILSAQGPSNLKVEVMYRLTQQGQAIHLVRESFGNGPGDDAGAVIATNVYKKDADGWHMYLHHASGAPVPAHHPQRPMSVH
jgi:ketosteroid isomerase-like protein